MTLVIPKALTPVVVHGEHIVLVVVVLLSQASQVKVHQVPKIESNESSASNLTQFKVISV